MKNSNIVEIIKNRFAEQKQTAGYKLQLNKIWELEDKFVIDFSKDKWKVYFLLDIEKGQLQLLEIDQILDFAIEFIRSLKL